jgi:site-specific DNA-methyltransferase (adenine-specific)/modification methylase
MLVLKSRHKIICGSFFDFKPNGIDAVVADPPYGCNEVTNRATNKRGKLAKSQDFKPVAGDDSNETARSAFAYLAGVKEQVWFGANFYPVPPSPSWIVWDKRGEVASDDNGDCELAWSNLGGPIRQFTHLWKGCIKKSEHGEKKIHPTQKPVALYSWLFERIEGIEVLDPFLGSGSSLIAAHLAGKNMVGIEIEPEYVDLVLARFQRVCKATVLKFPSLELFSLNRPESD